MVLLLLVFGLLVCDVDIDVAILLSIANVGALSLALQIMRKSQILTIQFTPINQVPLFLSFSPFFSFLYYPLSSLFFSMYLTYSASSLLMPPLLVFLSQKFFFKYKSFASKQPYIRNVLFDVHISQETHNTSIS